MLSTILSSGRHFNVPLRRTTTTLSLSFLPVSSYWTQSLCEHCYTFALCHTQFLIRTITKMCFVIAAFCLSCAHLCSILLRLWHLYVYILGVVCVDWCKWMALLQINKVIWTQCSFKWSSRVVIPQCLFALCHFKWVHLIPLRCAYVWCFHFSLKTPLLLMLCPGPNSLKRPVWVYPKLAISPTCCLMVNMKCISIAIQCIK